MRFPILLAAVVGALVFSAPQAVALDAPTGVVAIPHPEGLQQHGFGCGGAAVIIAPGQALTLIEALPSDDAAVPLLIAGRLVTATVVRRGEATGAVLLSFPTSSGADQPTPLSFADSARLRLGDVVWSAGNSYGILEQDGVVAISRGIVSGLYTLPTDSPVVRGRGGRVLGTYRGAVIESDAAINDGNQGGALLDDAGNLVALVTLAQTRERRLGTAIPIHLIAADLDLPRPTAVPDGGQGMERQLAEHATSIAASVALVYFERPSGPGNPPASPRPRPMTDEIPPYLRERLQQEWNRYYHQQQVFYTDQPVSALVVGEDLLLTAASNLHGAPLRGRVLTEVGPVDCEVVAVHRPLDLALLRTARRLPMPIAPLSERGDLAAGDALGVIGRHRLGAGHTLTTGVVSATERRHSQGEFVLHQTDAMANYGNLGGPVIDRHGDVVGLTVFLGPTVEQPWFINSGVAPFVDAGSIRRALPGLSEGISVTRSRLIGLGVSFDPQSLRVTRLVAGAGAEAAGVAVGDVLQAIDGETIRDLTDITRLLVRRRAGDTVTLRLQRDGEDVRLNVELRAFGDE